MMLYPMLIYWPYNGADYHISCCVSVYVCFCLSVCLSVCLWARLRSHFSTNLHEIWQEPLGSEKEELIRLRSKFKMPSHILTPTPQNLQPR